MSVNETLATKGCTQETAETVTRLCKLIILSIRHLKGPTVIHLSSWWKFHNFWLKSSLKKQANFIKSIIFFNAWLGNSILSKNWFLNSVNCPGCQLVLQNDHFLDRTFRVSNYNQRNSWEKAGSPWWICSSKMQANFI